jgi:hypothetical protein
MTPMVGSLGMGILLNDETREEERLVGGGREDAVKAN